MADIITDNADLKTLAPSFHRQNNNDNMKPYISNAAEIYIKPYVSAELYTQLATEQTNNTVTPANAKIISHLRTALAYFTLYDTLDFINVTVSSAGAMTNQAQNGQFTQVRQWEKSNAKQSAITKADQFLDRALETMYSTPTDYPLWTGSTTYTETTNLLIQDAKDFSSYTFPITRRTFLALYSWLATAEHRHIRAAIGSELLAGLKTRIAAGTLTTNDNIILPMIRKALAFYALFMGVSTIKLDIGQGGIRMVSTDDGITSFTPADKAYQSWRIELEQYAREALGECKVYLEENHEDFDEYENSAAKGNNTPRTSVRDNSTSNSSVML